MRARDKKGLCCQEAKLDIVAQLLELKPGQRIFDVGCGWGGSLTYLCKKYGKINRTTAHINEIYGFTGNYRSLGEELTLANEAGFEVQSIVQFPRSHYLKTAGDWINNMQEHRGYLEELVGKDYYKQFLVYLKIVYRIFSGEKLTIDTILSRKMPSA